MKTLMLALPAALTLVAAANEPAFAMPGDQLQASVTYAMRTDGIDVADTSQLTTSQLARLNSIYESDETPGNKNLAARLYWKQIGQ